MTRIRRLLGAIRLLSKKIVQTLGGMKFRLVLTLLTAVAFIAIGSFWLSERMNRPATNGSDVASVTSPSALLQAPTGDSASGVSYESLTRGVKHVGGTLASLLASEKGDASAPHENVGSREVVTYGATDYGSVFESPVIAAQSCSTSLICRSLPSLQVRISAHPVPFMDNGWSFSNWAKYSDTSSQAVLAVLLLVGATLSYLTLTVVGSNQVGLGSNSPPLIPKWRISKRFGAPIHRLAAF